MKFLLRAAALFAVFLSTLPPPGQAAQSKAEWELEWERTVAAAKKEKHYFRVDPVFSLREDVPPDPSIESYRPKPNDNFISVYPPEYRDLDAAFKVIDEALER